MGLFEDLRSEPVSELAIRKALTVREDAAIGEAIPRMKAERLGCVILVDAAGKPTGTFTEEELIRLLARGQACLAESVGKHRAAAWASVSEDEPVGKVLSLMDSRNLRFVIVTDAAGKAVGLTGQKGLMEYIADHFPREVLVRHVGRKPYIHEREGA
ncbi:MAG: CBS domain-containing protein [Planctomycetota bacterium]|nr:CBS domain-containing protein [Planctomycetota bacterium]